MKIRLSSLTKLLEMICGNEPFSYFPYRSSSLMSSMQNQINNKNHSFEVYLLTSYNFVGVIFFITVAKFTDSNAFIATET